MLHHHSFLVAIAGYPGQFCGTVPVLSILGTQNEVLGRFRKSVFTKLLAKIPADLADARWTIDRQAMPSFGRESALLLVRHSGSRDRNFETIQIGPLQHIVKCSRFRHAAIPMMAVMFVS